MSDLTLPFLKKIKQHNLAGKRFLVAVSGGVDSMVLAALLFLTEQKIVVAHCNFGLRGNESDGDEQLVRQWCIQNKIPFFRKLIPIPEIREKTGGNTEEIARRLRYEWFEVLRQEQGLDFIAVAHHREDVVETLLINLFKGTGISGLHGILPKRKHIVRPLLDFTKQELIAFAQKKKIPWREDQSNQTDDYLRNRLRHHLIPAIETEFPKVQFVLYRSAQRFRDVELIYEQAIQNYREQLLHTEGQDWFLWVNDLKKFSFSATLIYELLRPFGFKGNQADDLKNLLDAETGKYLVSERYLVFRKGDKLMITINKSFDPVSCQIEYPLGKELIPFTGGSLSIEEVGEIPEFQSYVKVFEKSVAWVCLNPQDFPIVLRPVRDGDYFFPFGMNGKKKTVGKFLRDLKITGPLKQRNWVLESNHRIVWVVGLRLDHRFRVQSGGAKIFKIQCFLEP